MAQLLWSFEEVLQCLQQHRFFLIQQRHQQLHLYIVPKCWVIHKLNVIETQKDTERLIENTHESVKLTLDTGHMLFAKGDSKSILQNYHERILHVHCKDIRKNILEKSLNKDLSFKNSFLDGVFTVPGDGCIDYTQLMKILFENKYSGWLVIEAEQDPAKANPFEYAKIGYNYLSSILSGIGYEI